MNRMIRKLRCIVRGYHDYQILMINKNGAINVNRCADCGSYRCKNLRENKFIKISDLFSTYNTNQWKIRRL